MKSTIFIFHGTAGYPQENWFPWLKQELKKDGHEVIVPQFPTPKGQSLENWLKVIKPYRKIINSDTIIIGHSLGGTFSLKLLELLETPIRAAVLIGTPIGIKPIENYYNDNLFCSFIFDWQKIRNNAKQFLVYHSDNDPYVSLANGQQLAKKLDAKLTFIPNAGHFNSKAGYTKFNNLLDKLKFILNNIKV